MQKVGAELLLDGTEMRSVEPLIVWVDVEHIIVVAERQRAPVHVIFVLTIITELVLLDLVLR